jgi:ubiquinone/menaquinone biosynthesis C-methylase UbiE
MAVRPSSRGRRGLGVRLVDRRGDDIGAAASFNRLIEQVYSIAATNRPRCAINGVEHWEDTTMTVSHASAREQFGRVAEAYVHSKGHAEGEDLERIVALATATREDRVLDIATGGGHTALALARVAGHVTASDLTPEMLVAAEAHLRGAGVANVDFAPADAQALPFPDSSFDIVTCRIAPHHFPGPAAFVREVRRVLRPGGRFLLEDTVVPAGEPAAYINHIERLRDPSHVRSLSVDEWWGLLLEAGFTVLHIETFRKRHDLAEWMERMQTPPEAQAEVRAAFVGAPPTVRRAFEVERDERGQPVAFWDLKGLFLAV